MASPFTRYLIGLGVCVVAVVVLVAMTLEWVRYRRGQTLIDGRQLALRFVGAALLLSALALVFVGELVIEFQDPWSFIGYWGAVAALSVALVSLAVVDLRRLRRRQHEHLKELAREFGDIVRDHVRQQTGPETNGRPH